MKKYIKAQTENMSSLSFDFTYDTTYDDKAITYIYTG